MVGLFCFKESNVLSCFYSLPSLLLGDYRSRQTFPKDWPESMHEFHLVVEGEAGPLMLSPSGQFITPSSCPVSLLISFMTSNLTEARSRLERHVADVKKEKDLTAQCIQTVRSYVIQHNKVMCSNVCVQFSLAFHIWGKTIM